VLAQISHVSTANELSLEHLCSGA